MSEPAEPEVQVWDSLQDLVALITAYRRGDDAGMQVLMAYCDQPVVLALAIHLLAQVAQEHHADYRSLLAWAFISLDKA
jgi:hypothetical protein